MGVTVTYRSPDVYSVARMRQFIDEAVASRPDGLVVSIPTPALAGAIRRAVRAGIPVVSINSGSDIFRRLGVLAHVGQEELPAGARGGPALAADGVRDALCVNHEPGNVGPDSAAAASRARSARPAARPRVAPIDLRDTAQAQRQIAAALRDPKVDGMLTLRATAARRRCARSPRAGAPATSSSARSTSRPRCCGRCWPAGCASPSTSRPTSRATCRSCCSASSPATACSPREGRVIPTGPHFVTRATAAQAIRLSQRGIR